MLSSRQWEALACALRIAADTYTQDAKHAMQAGSQRIAEQFEQQASEAGELLTWAECEGEWPDSEARELTETDGTLDEAELAAVRPDLFRRR